MLNASNLPRLVGLSLALVLGAQGLLGQVASQPGSKPPVGTEPSKTPILDSLQLDPIAPEAAAPEPAPSDAPRRISMGLGKEKRVVALGRRFAVLVGVGEAKVKGYELEPLPECLKDSREMASRLRKSGYTVNLLSEEATLPSYFNVSNVLRKVCREATADDQILMYFSSHGGVVDGDASIALKDQFIKLKEIKKALAGSKALVRLILLDACRDQKGFPAEISEFRDIHTILSCRPDESSLTIQGDMSVFTKVLIEGLTDCRADRVKDGQIELDELLYYLDEHVPALAARVNPGHKQNPTRTVVDPRAMNPVLTSCSIYEQLQLNLQPVAVEGPVGRGPRNDMIISAAMAGKVTIGMEADSLIAKMGQPSTPVDFDADGKDLFMYTDQPSTGATTLIFFENRRVASVMVMYKKTCETDFDAAASRKAVRKLLGNRQATDLEGLLLGQDLPTLVAKIGCPSTVLAYSTDDQSQLVSWNDVPEEGMELTIKLGEGKAIKVMVGTTPKK